MPTVGCPHCGETIDTFPDPGGGETQEYVEDCSVCCRAVLFTARLDDASGEYAVHASSEV